MYVQHTFLKYCLGPHGVTIITLLYDTHWEIWHHSKVFIKVIGFPWVFSFALVLHGFAQKFFTILVHWCWHSRRPFTASSQSPYHPQMTGPVTQFTHQSFKSVNYLMLEIYPSSPFQSHHSRFPTSSYLALPSITLIFTPRLSPSPVVTCRKLNHWPTHCFFSSILVHVFVNVHVLPEWRHPQWQLPALSTLIILFVNASPNALV